jgi:hypothetical protein
LGQGWINPDRAEFRRLTFFRRLDAAVDAVCTDDQIVELAYVQHILELAVRENLSFFAETGHVILE